MDSQRKHICGSQGEGDVGEGWSGSLGLADENWRAKMLA